MSLANTSVAMPNHSFKIFLVFSLVLVGLFLIYSSVSAAEECKTGGLVPCGRLCNDPSTPEDETRPCTTCDLFALASRVINFVLFTLVPAIAVLFYLWAGLMVLLGGANPGLVKTGYGIFRTTTYGLLIIFGAWMITNTVLKSLAGDGDYSKKWFTIECTGVVQQLPTITKYACNSLNQCVVNQEEGTYINDPTCGGKNECGLPADCVDIDENGQINEIDCGAPENEKCSLCFAPPGPTVLTIATPSLPDALVNTRYNATITASGGKAPYSFSITSGTLPPGMLMAGNGTITGTPATTGTYSFTIKVEDSSTPVKQSATRQLSIKVVTESAGVQCLFSGVNLCEGQSPPGGCANSNCSQYAVSINKYASGAATASMLKSILFNESSCNISAANPAGNSYGLMQMQPSTANMYKTRCDVSENITSSWLTNPANADKSICIAAQYVSAIAQSRCGSSTRNIYAGYNGGTGVNGACGQSTSCAGDKNCEGQSVMRWECLYDNTQHTVCNTGYNETKAGVRKVVYCNNNPGF